MRVAIDFMRWWYQPDVQLEFARRGGNPCDKATLERSDFDQIQPWFKAYKFMLDGRSKDFWHHPNYSRMLSVQQEAFTSYMTGQTDDPMAALNYAACQQQQILHDAGTAAKAPSDACSGANL
jgi:multiple sugar transport system substrate-binding protein